MRNTVMILIAGFCLNLLAPTKAGAVSTDFDAVKKQADVVQAWMTKVHFFDKSTPNQEMIRLAYAPSSLGPSPYESMRSMSAFLNDAATKLVTSEDVADKVRAQKARELSVKFKNLAETLDLVKPEKKDASTLSKSISVSAAYGRLLEMKDAPEFDRAVYNQIVIATANRERGASASAVSAPNGAAVPNAVRSKTAR